MDQIKENLKKNTAILDPYANMVPVFGQIAAQADINPGAVLGLISGVLLLILIVLQGWAILVTTLTVLYPALLSIRAIQSEDDEDDKVWLSYWMIFGIYTVLETFFGFIFYFIPYWTLIRSALFMWLLLPQFKGSQTVYEQVLRPLLKANQDLIEKYAQQMTSTLQEAQEQAKKEAASAVSDAMKDPKMMVAAAQGMAKAQDMADDAFKVVDDAPVEATNE